jgi:hypothetical protein
VVTAFARVLVGLGFLVSAGAYADTPPSDFELQVAYCLGSAQVTVERFDSMFSCEAKVLGAEFCRRQQQTLQQTKQSAVSNFNRLRAYKRATTRLHSRPSAAGPGYPRSDGERR